MNQPKRNSQEAMEIFSSIMGLAEILEDDIDRRAHLETEPFLDDAKAAAIVTAIRQQAIQGYGLAEALSCGDEGVG